VEFKIEQGILSIVIWTRVISFENPAPFIYIVVPPADVP